MKISSRLDFALSCVLRIADNYSSGSLTSIKEICKKEKLEFDYVEKLLIAMKNGGILKSIRGRSGGYALTAPPKEISAKEVVKAVEKETLGLVCYRKGRRHKCVHLDDCRIRCFWMELKDHIENFLARRSLEDLVKLRRQEKDW